MTYGSRANTPADGRCQGPVALLPEVLPLGNTATSRAVAYLKDRRVCVKCAINQGWAGTPLGVYIPARHSWDGPVEFWQIRRFENTEPRYVSPHFSRGDTMMLFSTVLYPKREVYITEGPFDALRSLHPFQEGKSAIGLMGQQIPETAWVRLGEAIRDIPRIVFAVDSDARGVMTQYAAMLALAGHTVEFADPYPNKDFGQA